MLQAEITMDATMKIPTNLHLLLSPLLAPIMIQINPPTGFSNTTLLNDVVPQPNVPKEFIGLNNVVANAVPKTKWGSALTFQRNNTIYPVSPQFQKKHDAW
jgi:hypothetical protein